MTETLVDVAVPFAVKGTFHYGLDPAMAESLTTGSLVQVSFRNRSTHAFVLGFPETTQVPAAKLKVVEAVLAADPLFDDTMYKLLKWVSDYYCHPLGEVLSCAVPKNYWKRKPGGKSRANRELMQRLEAEGTPSAKPVLNEEQRVAVEQILSGEGHKTALLHGVTGSGKTEVYMAVLETVLARNQGAIILVPEIALTPQLLGRFSLRFPGQVAVLHSDLTPTERFAQWERLKQGHARIVIGARSAVFAPVRDLGLIVVDEEHETSFKQEDSIRYHARDVAVVRGSMMGAKVILGSATPSVESYANAQVGKYLHLTLKKRVEDRPMPRTTFVDIKDKEQWYSPKIPWLSQVLAAKMHETLASGNQVMLYLNRLGYGHFLFCLDCGHSWRCMNCDVALTYYRHPPLLKCHYCNFMHTPPEVCTECQGRSLQSLGLGTEQVQKEITALFPKARVERMDRSAIKTRKDLEAILERINNREIDILVGTQMIAKGHDFPGIALVGVLVADATLNMPDFRAHERTFQIVTQVSGRAGRAGTPGEVVIQSLNPEHPVLRAAAENRADDFYRWELDARRQFGFPPHQRLAMLRFQHRNLAQVEGCAVQLVERMKAEALKQNWRCRLLGPSEAPLSRLKNLYRWHCLVKAEGIRDLQALLRQAQDWHTASKNPVQFFVDVDPMNAM